MTNQLIETLENQHKEMGLLIQQLKSANITIEDVKEHFGVATDVIVFEGQKYRKVDRLAREGDVVVLNDVGGSHYFETNKPYKVQRDTRINGVGKRSGHKEAHPLYTEYYNRTPETVDVYELITPVFETNEGQDLEAEQVKEEKTPNQLRAEIIEKAKTFVSTHFWNQVNSAENPPNSFAKDFWYETNFVTKNNRVTALIHSLTGIGESSINPVAVGRATCAEGDVFNEHIGKVIALGRALGLDVSEFEQAVQPTVKVVGQIVGDGDCNLTLIPSTEVARLEDGTARIHSMAADSFPIINDTNAQYGGNA